MEVEGSNGSIRFEYCATPASREEQQMKRFLGELKLEYLSEVFKDCGVTYGRLRYLKKEDFEEILPGRKNIGARAEIREKLLEWKAKRPHSEETTIIESQKRERVTSWIEMPETSKLSQPPSIIAPPLVTQHCIEMPEKSKPSPPLSIIAPPTAVQRCIEMQEKSKPSPPPSIIAPNTAVQHCIEMQEKSKLSPAASIIGSPKVPLIVTTAIPRSSDSSVNIQYEHVREILQNSVKGQTIIKFYDSNKFLNEFNRKELVNCIGENFLDITTNEFKFPRPCVMEKLAEEIAEIFPSEDKDSYYISRKVAKRPNPTGRLYNRFSNLNRNKLIKKTELKMAGLKAKMKEMLNTDKDAIPFWVQSFKLRQLEYANLSSSDIFHEWVFLKQNGGEKFVDIDFEMMFPSAKNQWEFYRQKLLYYYKENLKEKQFKAIFDEMQSKVTDKDSEDCILVLLLNAVLKPTHRLIETDPDTKRIVRKVSIIDAINSFILHLPVLKDLKDALEGRSTIQPFIIVVGLKLSELREFYISIDDIVLKMPSFIAALDLCFKIFHVFDLNYSKESLRVWLFLQKCIYDINTVRDIEDSAITKLMASLHRI